MPMTVVEALALVLVRRLAAEGEAKRLRVLAGLSLAEMAAVVGVSPSTILRWEDGQTVPHGDGACRYLEALAGIEDVVTKAS